MSSPTTSPIHWFDNEINYLLSRDICDALNDIETLIYIIENEHPTQPRIDHRDYSHWLNRQLAQPNRNTHIKDMHKMHYLLMKTYYAQYACDTALFLRKGK